MADQENQPAWPRERAARSDTDSEELDRQAEKEADIVIGDVDDYIAQTQPSDLAEAEIALNAWQIPTDPLEGVPGDIALEPGKEGEPLESIFSARTEAEAIIVRGLVESEGIAVIFREVATPTYGSIFSVSEARWADLLVSAKDADQARAIIEAATPQAGGAI